MKLIQQSLAIIGLSTLIALLVAFAHPQAPAPPWLEEVDMYLINSETLKTLDTITWVDARSAVAYAGTHAPEAVHLNEDNWESAFIDLIEAWTPGSAIVVYCDASDCHASEAVAQRLRRELDFPEVYYLEGGWESLSKDLQ